MAKANINIEPLMKNIAKGLIIHDLFDQGNTGLLKFDRTTGILLINENVLMQIIQLVNPLQEPREFKLLKQEEWIKG